MDSEGEANLDGGGGNKVEYGLWGAAVPAEPGDVGLPVGGAGRQRGAVEAVGGTTGGGATVRSGTSAGVAGTRAGSDCGGDAAIVGGASGGLGAAVGTHETEANVGGLAGGAATGGGRGAEGSGAEGARDVEEETGPGRKGRGRGDEQYAQIARPGRLGL